MGVVCIVGSRDLNHRELLEVEKQVIELIEAGHHILTDGSKTVGLRVMETAFKLDPSKIYVYLHSVKLKNPVSTHAILNKIPTKQVLEIPGPYNQRNIFARNKKMVESSNLVIAYWKNQSPGTKHVIECAKKNKPEEVPLIINYC